jgi:hypothetical protein
LVPGGDAAREGDVDGLFGLDGISVIQLLGLKPKSF